jgi:hypothetical protein
MFAFSRGELSSFVWETSRARGRGAKSPYIRDWRYDMEKFLESSCRVEIKVQEGIRFGDDVRGGVFFCGEGQNRRSANAKGVAYQAYLPIDKLRSVTEFVSFALFILRLYTSRIPKGRKTFPLLLKFLKSLTNHHIQYPKNPKVHSKQPRYITICLKVGISGLLGPSALSSS